MSQMDNPVSSSAELGLDVDGINVSSIKPKVNDNGVAQIDLLYDSDCPICMMEVNFLQKRDIDNLIRFTDLNSPDYNSADHGNVKFKEGMRKIRAVLPSGQVVIGIEVFRQTYEAIGLGWVFALTKIPFIGKLADQVYDIWAENRLRLTGRPELAEVLKERKVHLQNTQDDIDECDSDACGLDFSDIK
jgi:predicted DCC family thiol-disulfide oxidoreductase YuxK